jgi:hypothetical protein
MRIPRVLSLLLGLSTASTATSTEIYTPEDAVRALEAAYIQKNIEAAVAAKDFVEEARFMLQKMSAELAADTEILKQTAEVLELSYRQEIRTNGFPNFSNLKCTFVARQDVSSALVKLTEECVFPDGGKSVQDVFVSKGKRSWRVVTMPTDS